MGERQQRHPQGGERRHHHPKGGRERAAPLQRNSVERKQHHAHWKRVKAAPPKGGGSQRAPATRGEKGQQLHKEGWRGEKQHRALGSRCCSSFWVVMVSPPPVEEYLLPSSVWRYFAPLPSFVCGATFPSSLVRCNICCLVGWVIELS